MLRIHLDELALGENQFMFLGDEPFTGLAFEEFSDGTPSAETEYVNGLPQGVGRVWAESGILVEECRNWAGVRHGESRSWAPTGRLRIRALYELGILVSETVWNESGEVTRDWRITPQDSLYSTLEISRSKFGKDAPPL